MESRAKVRTDSDDASRRQLSSTSEMWNDQVGNEPAQDVRRMNIADTERSQATAPNEEDTDGTGVLDKVRDEL
jgi:hypothetical protein